MKIIPYIETAKRMILLQDYIKLNNLRIEKIEFKEPVEKVLGEEDSDTNRKTNDDSNAEGNKERYGEITINIELYGQYEDLKTLIEQIKASIKPFVIGKIEITPREEEASNTPEDNIQANIELYTYALLNNARDVVDGLNYNFMEYEYEYKNPFKPLETIDDRINNELKESIGDKIEEEINKILDKDIPDYNEDKTYPTEDNPPSSKAKEFIIAIKDVYASGDNFYIVGPGNKGDYTTIQARTIEPVNFYLSVSSTGYEYAIEARDQEMKTFQKKIPLDQCKLIVDSTVMAIRNNQELKTGIFIANNMDKLLHVELKGNYLDNIYIYTSSGEQIKVGETKENIQVSIRK